MKETKKLLVLMLVLLTGILLLSACAETSAEEFEFTALEDGTYSVSGYTGDSVKINIPAEYNNIKVTTIGEEAFANSQIQTITGGRNIERIEKEAFANCYVLKSFDVKGNITDIKSYAFYKCTNLTNITLPDTLESLGYNAFEQCTSLRSVKIPMGVEKLESSTFLDCTALKSVELPEALTNIGTRAFSGCISLKEIKISKSLKIIEYEAFKNCHALSSFTIPATVTLVGENAFNTDITITVEGSTVGWTSSWYAGLATVIYNDDDNANDIPDADIKHGTYSVYGDTSFGLEMYLTVDDDELVIMTKSGAHLTGNTYRYKIQGNSIQCTPRKNQYAILELTYNEKTERITWSFSGVDVEFYWTDSEIKEADFNDL